jgi:hypothetical protein
MAKQPKFVSASDKFAAKYGICNKEGQLLSEWYVRQYIHCWCRLDSGFDTDKWQPVSAPEYVDVNGHAVVMTNREMLIDYFMTDKWLRAHPGLTGSEIGHEACLSTLWDEAGCSPVRSAADIKKIATRKAGIKAPETHTGVGREAAKQAVAANEERKIAEAKAKKLETILAMDTKQLKQMMTMDVSILPAESQAYIAELRTIYAEYKQSTKKTVDASK